MKITSFEPTISSKDGMARIRVVGSIKGVLGQLVEKTGFLKFETQEEADAAYDTLQSGDVALNFINPDANNLYQIEVASVGSTVTHN